MINRFKRQTGFTSKCHRIFYKKKIVEMAVIAVLTGFIITGVIKIRSYSKVESAIIPKIETAQAVEGTKPDDKAGGMYEIVDKTDYIEYEIPVKEEKEITDIDMDASRQINLENIMNDLTEETDEE